MRLYQTQFDGLPVGEERSKLVEKNATELKWLLRQTKQLGNTFEPYLGFATIK